MRAWLSLASLLGGIVLLTAACATSEEWSEWRSHTTHFASGTHGFFSLRNNKDGSNPRVSRTDVDAICSGAKPAQNKPASRPLQRLWRQYGRGMDSLDV